MKTVEKAFEEFDKKKTFNGWTHWEIWNHGVLWADRTNESAAELKKENEQLKSAFYDRVEIITRQVEEKKHLRELISKVKKAIVEDAIHWDPAKANELLQDCEEALRSQ